MYCESIKDTESVCLYSFRVGKYISRSRVGKYIGRSRVEKYIGRKYSYS